MQHPVQYVAVETPDGEVVGYVWADYAAGTLKWTRRAATGADGYRLGETWAAKVAEARERGLTLAGALTRLARDAGTGPPLGVRGPEAVDELARAVTEADDRRLLAQLDHGDIEAWQELADAYAALTEERERSDPVAVSGLQRAAVAGRQSPVGHRCRHPGVPLERRSPSRAAAPWTAASRGRRTRRHLPRGR